MARAATLSTGSAWPFLDRHAALAATYGSHDAGTCGHNFLAWALALRGRSDDANRASEEGVALARRLGLLLAGVDALLPGAAGSRARQRCYKDERAGGGGRCVSTGFQAGVGWALTLQGRLGALTQIVSRKAWSKITTLLREVRATGGYQFVPFPLSLKAHAHLTQAEPAMVSETVEDACPRARR